jgi:hypothetical protein
VIRILSFLIVGGQKCNSELIFRKTAKLCDSESHSYPPIIKEYDILITHDINIYRNTHSQNFDDIVVKYCNL